MTAEDDRLDPAVIEALAAMRAELEKFGRTFRALEPPRLVDRAAQLHEAVAPHLAALIEAAELVDSGPREVVVVETPVAPTVRGRPTRVPYRPFRKAERMLAKELTLREIGRQAGIDHRVVAKIRDWRDGRVIKAARGDRVYEAERDPVSGEMLLRLVAR